MIRGSIETKEWIVKKMEKSKFSATKGQITHNCIITLLKPPDKPLGEAVTFLSDVK